MKFGWVGKPKSRFVFMDSNEERIFWRSPEQNPNQSRFIYISEIIDISTGIHATSVMKKNKVPMEFDHLCFSIISRKRLIHFF